MVFGRRYRVTERIGSGGMADVFKAVDETLGRTVAVKVMHARYASDPNFAARFRQEAQAAANLQSPYIVNIYDWGQDGNTYYIVMEYVRGTDLKSIIQTRGALPAKNVAEIGAQVCSALSVAHGYDIIHRDIKPHNIMVGPDGAVKVMDFGIARAGNTTMTQTGSVLGTAHYVSPEQAQGRPLTAASDLYSLGIVLYEASTARLPFDADTPVAVALKQVNEAPRPPHELVPSVDPGLEAVIMRALTKQPTTRYATAEEMRRDLVAVSQGRDPQATAVLAGGSAGVAAAAAGAAGAAGDATDTTAVMPQVGSQRGATSPAGVAPRGPARKKRSPLPWILVAVLLAAAGLGLAWKLGAFGPGTSQVPDVTGMPYENAKSMIVEREFEVGKKSTKYDDKIEEGSVISQDPLPEVPAKRGTAVNLVVSLGPRPVGVPNLVGLKEDKARETLTQLGLQADKQADQPSDKYDKGVVFSQYPEEGEKVAPGTPVQFTVSSGPPNQTVPNVVGKTQSAAQKALKDKGLKWTIKEQTSDTVAKGKVIEQSPTPGLSVAPGTPITLTVSTGKPPVEVPNVVGMFPDEAEATLKSKGFKVDRQYTPQANSNKVVNQDPTGPNTAAYGSSVTIWIDAADPG
ncbi:MAG TPA: Stk1 family PASTA domain-containing Ser/Thr kinase [Coriobacteriia bacterium]|nr:Stk1 family PASTA domain-containing Ser/Thr kinase [Coriobacteriia bacterium]